MRAKQVIAASNNKTTLLMEASIKAKLTNPDTADPISVTLRKLAAERFFIVISVSCWAVNNDRKMRLITSSCLLRWCTVGR